MSVAVVYWSGTGNTEKMAMAIADGINKQGGNADVYVADDFSAGHVSKYEKFAFGCPAMGDEILEEDVFEPMFTAVEGNLKGKKIALFGSYDWGDGQWMREWEDRVKSKGAVLIGSGLIVHETPGADDVEACEKLGANLEKS